MMLSRIRNSDKFGCWIKGTSDTAAVGRIPQLEVGYRMWRSDTRVCKSDNGAVPRIPRLEVGYRVCTSDTAAGGRIPCS